jgi:acetylornithine deacetylase/succinyl-diaminopimelate desuccinylase-like protein
MGFSARGTIMSAILEPADAQPAVPSTAARTMIERLIAFNTISRDSNLGLIEWVRDYLHGLGATIRLTHDASGKKANLFATLGDSAKPGLILSGHTDVVPVDGQNWIPTRSLRSNATASSMRAVRRT